MFLWQLPAKQASCSWLLIIIIFKFWFLLLNYVSGAAALCFRGRWFPFNLSSSPHCSHSVRCLLLFLRLAARGCLKSVCQTKAALQLQQRASLHREDKTKIMCAQWVGREWTVFRRLRMFSMWSREHIRRRVFLFMLHSLSPKKRFFNVFTWREKRQTSCDEPPFEPPWIVSYFFFNSWCLCTIPPSPLHSSNNTCVCFSFVLTEWVILIITQL